MEQGPPGTGPLSPDFSGIDPGLMSTFIASLTSGRDVIKEEMEAIRRLLTSADLSSLGLQPVGQILDWLETELPQLRRRNQAIQASANIRSWAPGLLSGLVPLDEKTMLSQAEARRQGKALAERFAGIQAIDWGWPGGKTNDDVLAEMAAELGAHWNDADFSASFFATLGAEGTLGIPAKLRAGMKDPDDTIDLVSRAFGTAVSFGAQVPGFAETRYEMVTGRDPGHASTLFQPPKSSAIAADFAELKDNAGAYDPEHGNQALGDLLRTGDFPAAWLSTVVSRHALSGESTVNGTSLAGYLYALGNNPEAARTAISTATKEYGSLAASLHRLNERVKVSSTFSWQADLQEKENSRADAFGRMLAAASGAYDEKDGAHSTEAVRNAFQLMTTLPSLKIAEPTRIRLAELAGSYATEIVEGANLGDANRTQPSAFEDAKTIIPGLDPVFRLSPKDTYEFVKTFANSPGNIKPFEEGMGVLADRLINTAAAKDGGNGVGYLERTMRAMGYVAGLQFAAEREVQGKLDAIDQQRIKAQMFAAGLALGVGGLAVPGMGGQILWLGLSTLAPPGLESVLEIDETRMDALTAKSDAAALAMDGWMANMLMEHGFKAKVPLTDARFSHPPITDDNGNLLSFDKIAKDKNALKNFNDWLIANGSGGTEKKELGEAHEWLKVVIDGSRGRALKQNPSPFD
ncbi:hypothetical protein GCM10009555_000680 [Acrocarpospora macrocephala]|uniref:DUF6571 domain-containing protein n=1 Tax=Acrocarpospora macrocephala TaxID=150177 RepID=A0A5M3WWI0_9ACTN|nr:DUF6571 family protein [Acrocarpospora macrocephala]GES11661.1 hypothetical protein Amac_052580 [Acrocarpospora macrocephala]